MRRPMILFYIVVIYIFTSFIWWTFLLMEKNREIFTERTELMKLHLIQQNISPEKLNDSREFLSEKKKYNAQQTMVIGESAVFLFLILIGAVQLRKSFLKEINFNLQQKNFLLSITHELRSPLASTKVALQTLQRHQLPPEKSQPLIRNGLDDVDRLQTLVENLLLATKIEDHTFKLGNEHCDLSEIVNNTIRKYRESGRTFEADVTHDIIVVGDKMGLHSVISNLVENALKYSPEKSTIRISLKEKGTKALFTIADEGSGIPLNERSQIFKKFYRVGSEQTRKTKGTGLGLFIVDKILSLHKGRVTVKDNVPHGSVFEVELPIG